MCVFVEKERVSEISVCWGGTRGGGRTEGRIMDTTVSCAYARTIKGDQGFSPTGPRIFPQGLYKLNVLFNFFFVSISFS